MTLDDQLRAAAQALASDGNPDQLLRDYQRLEAQYQALQDSPSRQRRLARELADQTRGENDYRMGGWHEEAGNLHLAASHFEKAARAGIADATVRLAHVLALLQDDEEAEDWYLLAAAEGWVEAQEHVAGARAATSPHEPASHHPDGGRGTPTRAHCFGHDTETAAHEPADPGETADQPTGSATAAEAPRPASVAQALVPGSSAQAWSGGDEFGQADDGVPAEKYIVVCPACGGDGRVIPPGSLTQVSCRVCWERGRVSRIVADKYLRSHDKHAG